MTGIDERLMRWAILGTGSVSRKFCLGLQALGKRAEVGPVASRKPENARNFVSGLGLGEVAESYAEAVAARNVDAVYIATPADLHETHAALAFAAGKPALIEKPLAADAAAARRIAEAASTAGVFAMEALWTRFLPLMRLVSERIEVGALGSLRGYDGHFMAANLPDPAVSLFAPPAGGALLHRGIYPLSLARFFLGPVTDLKAMARQGETGVDDDSVLLLTHASGAISTIRASLRAGGVNSATIWGERARLEIEGPIWRPGQARLIPAAPSRIVAPRPRRLEAFRESRLGQRIAGLRAGLRRNETVWRADFIGNGYAHEAAHLMEALAAGRTQSDILPLTESIEVLDLIDQARAQMLGTDAS